MLLKYKSKYLTHSSAYNFANSRSFLGRISFLKFSSSHSFYGRDLIQSYLLIKIHYSAKDFKFEFSRIVTWINS